MDPEDRKVPTEYPDYPDLTVHQVLKAMRDHKDYPDLRVLTENL